MVASNYDLLRKQARQLENEIDLKLVAFSKIGAGSNSSTNSTSNSIVGSNNGSDSAPLLGEHIFDSLSEEIAQKLEKLSTINETMTELPATGAAAMHTLQRHREILRGYRQEFSKICSNHSTRMEREELLRGSGVMVSHQSSPSISGLSRREMYLKENAHINSSSNLMTDQINIAIDTREHLLSQRQTFKKLQTRFNNISNRFPLISSLIQRINFKKRRDSLIVGAVIGICIVLLLIYTFH